MIKQVGVWVIWILSLTLAAGRTFTDVKGRQVDAEVLSVQEGTVTLSVKGKASKFPIADLSAEDQAYLKEWQAARAASPGSPTAAAQAKVEIVVETTPGKSPYEISREKLQQEQANKPGVKPGSNPVIPGSRPVFNPPVIPDLPGQIREHYVLKITNLTPGRLSRFNLKVKFYLRNQDGSILPSDSVIELQKPIGGNETYSITMQSRIANASAGQSFGGYWVEAYQGKEKIGEIKVLAADVDPEKVTPPGV